MPGATTSIQDADRVADAAQDLWESLGESCDVLPWAAIAESVEQNAGDAIRAAVIVPRLGRIECVIKDNSDLKAARDAIDSLVAKGWAVSALLPVRTLGAAHEAFRGLDIVLQGWWDRVGSGLKFTEPEVP